METVAQSFRVRLLAPSGREQPVILEVDKDGIAFLQEDGQVIQSIPYASIIKWVPSNLRSRDRGDPDCLDIQVETTAGRRDLRMRCESAGAVMDVIHAIRGTVQTLVRALHGDSEEGAGGPGDAASGVAGEGMLGRPADSPKSPQTVSAPSKQQQQQLEMGPLTRNLPRVSSPSGGSLPRQGSPAVSDAASAAAGAHAMGQAASDGSTGVEAPMHTTSTIVPVTRATAAQPQEQGGQQLQTNLAVKASSGVQQQQVQGQQQQADSPVRTRQQLEAQQPQQEEEEDSGSEEWDEDGAMGLEEEEEQQQQQRQPCRGSQEQRQQQKQQQQQLDWQQKHQRARQCLSSPEAWMIRTGTPGTVSAATGPRSPGLPFSTMSVAAAGGSEGAAAKSPAAGSSARSRHHSGVTAVAPAPPQGLMTRLGWDGVVEGLEEDGDREGAYGIGMSGAAQMRFLEEIIKRLSAELARRMSDSEDPLLPTVPVDLTTAVGAAAGMSPGAAAASAVPLPPWMRDAGFLNPLIAAYDERVRTLESEAAAKSEAVRAIEAQVRDLIEENERLHNEARRTEEQLEGRAMAAAASMVAGPGSGACARARLQERLDLLEQENDLLVAQQQELDSEIARLNAALDAAAGASSEVAAARGEVVRLQGVERELSKARAALKATRARCKVLDRDLADARATAEDHRAQAEAARAVAGRAAEEARAAVRREEEAHMDGGRAAALQAECDRLREARAASDAAATAAASDRDALRGALRSLEARLRDYQRRDAEVYSRIKDAMEAAEGARLERDAAVAAADARAHEVAALTARLSEAAKELGDCGGASAAARRADAAEARAAEAEGALEEAAKQACELRAALGRVTRDNASLQNELSALREAMASGVGASDFKATTIGSHEGGSAVAVAARERLAAAERAAEAAAQRAASSERAAARAVREWELTKAEMQAELQALRRRLSEAEACAATATTDRATAEQAAAAAAAEAAALREARGAEEARLEARLREVQEGRDAVVAGLSQQLERALKMCSSTVAEAEAAAAAKDELLSQWQEEAQQLAAAVSTLEGKLAAMEAALAESERIAAVAQEERDTVAMELLQTRAAVEELEGLLWGSQGAAEEVRGLETQLERALVDKAGAERARDAMAIRLDIARGEVSPGGGGIGRQQLVNESPSSPAGQVPSRGSPPLQHQGRSPVKQQAAHGLGAGGRGSSGGGAADTRQQQDAAVRRL